MSAPDWLVVGAKVVEFTSGRLGGTASMKYATVEKIGKRDAVLDNGNRWNVNRLVKRRGQGWDPSTELLSADDPRVTAARAANRVVRLRSEAENAWDEFRRAIRNDPTPDAEAVDKAGDALIEAVQAFLHARSRA